jgi:hypothetical protein
MADLSCVPRAVKKEFADQLVAETWKLMLLSKLHSPNPVAQTYVSDVVANEITDSGGKYTAGGVVVSGKVSVADGNNYYLDLADITIGPGATLNYRYGILFQDTGNQATSKIRAQVDFLTDQIDKNGTSTIQWNNLGIIYLQ